MMFSGFGRGLAVPQNTQPVDSANIPPATPVRFPTCWPRNPQDRLGSTDDRALVDILRKVERPADIRIEHLEALGLHVTLDVSLEEIIPEDSYLPSKEWETIQRDEVDDLDFESKRPLNNGKLSPGIKIYMERCNELAMPNAPAFRTVRRIPTPAGEPNVRLGNAYEFFKNLELMAGFWDDTTVEQTHDTDAMNIDSETPLPTMAPISNHSTRLAAGSSMPPDYRNAMLTAFVKIVAYEFGCNVSLPRVEPRLYITSRPSTSSSKPSEPRVSSFPTNMSFVYRTPTDRNSARTGIVEGPVAALSSRPSTIFSTQTEQILDLAREVVASLVTAQLRNRENKTESRSGVGKWWCTTPRWGGGTGGPIGREGDRLEKLAAAAETEPLSSPPKRPHPLSHPDSSTTKYPTTTYAQAAAQTAMSRTPAPSDGPSPPKRQNIKKTSMPMYDNYRMVRPPSSTWDKKARYQAIGKVAHASHDDIFLLSALNHHVALLRMRVPKLLLEQLDGEGGERMALEMVRSRWWDMFVPADRVEAMRGVWGMMAWLMRKVEGEGEGERKNK